jgi:hypothetical protein
MGRFVLFGLGSLALGGCTPLGLWLYQEPAFEVSQVRLQHEQPADSAVLVGLAVWNPNDYDLTTSRFELKLDIDGRTVGRYSRDSIIPVGRITTDTLSLPFLPPSDRGDRLAPLPPGTHHVEVEGSAFLTTPFGERRIRVAHAGDVEVDTAEANDAGEDQARKLADTPEDTALLANRKAQDSLTAPTVDRRRRY